MPDSDAVRRPANAPFTLFEVSWEVCNKVGGIYTVVSSKAKLLVERFGDEYVCVGPWLLSAQDRESQFEEERGFEEFAESCRRLGVPVRVGRWRIPGRPRTVLVEFTGLLSGKDAWFARLWEKHRVDSLTGGWDYAEPVMFGRAAGMVIEQWWKDFVAPAHREAAAQFHEWMTGSGLLYLKELVPPVGTVFTTHATVLGRALASRGRDPGVALPGKPEDEARALNVVAKHSMEAAVARAADVFTTVSEVTAQEAGTFLGRRPSPITPNGIDLEVADALAAEVSPADARAALLRLAARFLGEEVPGAALVGTSGRYEFHNKGIDVLLDAFAGVNRRPGRPVVLFLFIPAGASAIRIPPSADGGGPGRRPSSVVSTHHLFEEENDAIQSACAKHGLDNAPGSRVRVIHVPVYLRRGDGVLDLPYEGVLRGLDLTCFPSFYEPWGLTPVESLVAGVPTVTTDYTGFGRWMREHGVGEDRGLTVLDREGIPYAEVTASLLARVEALLAAPGDREATAATCRAAAAEVAWTDLVGRYAEAFEVARDEASRRAPLPGHAPVRSEAARGGAAPRPSPARPRLRTFEVTGSLPPELDGLKEISRNYFWTWDAGMRALFEEIDPERWQRCGRNPARLLREVRISEVRKRAVGTGLAERVKAAVGRLRAAAGGPPDPVAVAAGITAKRPVAYFSAEFGIESTLQTYTGGLGILAGDHLKAASDLGLPLVGVGLFYHRGYLRQRIGQDGSQLWSPADNAPDGHALDLVRDESGAPLEIPVVLPGGRLVLHAWRAMVGRVPLFLLDADLPANRPEDRTITHHLYGGDEEMRLRQEVVLGRGGPHLLHLLGIHPSVIHLNEGHAAFAPLTRVAGLVRHQGLTFEEAREAVRSGTVFTTHTPVPAGHDCFPESLMRRYFSDVESWVGLPWERFFALGTSDEDPGGFMMTRLAARLASFVNGVSAIHAGVSRRILSPVWPGFLRGEVPVVPVTNGIHLPTWTAPEVAALVRPGGGAPLGSDFAERAPSVAPAALWRARTACRHRLLDALRARVRASSAELKEPPEDLRRSLDGLDENALLIGFARRFAPYKRADLLFRDPDALLRVLDREDRPIRILYAGKAHPRDGQGQEILRRVAARARSAEFRGKVYFLEDYDMELGRLLVQGVDVWLNNPDRPLEACGTSGMKAAANGVLNLSVLDGWWPEAFDGLNGWAITGGETGETAESRNALDAEDVLRKLEREIGPLFFDRDDDGVPLRWLERVRHCLATVPPRFGTGRMVEEYRDRAYLPLARAHDALRADDYAGAREIVGRKRRLRRGFGDVRILSATLPDAGRMEVRDELKVEVEVDRGGLEPGDLLVELVLARREPDGEPAATTVVEMQPAGPQEGRRTLWQASCCMGEPGSFSCGVRVRVRDPEGGPPDPAQADLLLWA
ncbi:MAG: alpha-glucan family phosphorylase [Planctomycetes bacterium]|nr:alpha-glucan family phosphorylase [Planctomycetota bacterium]